MIKVQGELVVGAPSGSFCSGTRTWHARSCAVHAMMLAIWGVYDNGGPLSGGPLKGTLIDLAYRRGTPILANTNFFV